MMGVPILGPTDVFCDNDGVVKNTTALESVLKKKHLSICYHFICECSAELAAQISHIPTNFNLSDLATKVLDQDKGKEIVRQLLYWKQIHHGSASTLGRGPRGGCLWNNEAPIGEIAGTD